MLELLKYLKYDPPKIQDYDYENVKVTYQDNHFRLTIDDKQWMTYDTKTHEQVFEVFSHYDLARGNVVVTGLGFGARERWLLTKKNVSKLTVIEKNLSLINYHYRIQSDFIFNEKLEIVNCDAEEYDLPCDTLLLDHYEMEDIFTILNSAKKIHDKANCQTFWFWPFEKIISHSRKWHSRNDKPQKLYSFYEAFQLLKQNHKLNKLPNLNEETVNLYCMMYNSILFSKSNVFVSSNPTNDALFFSHNQYKFT